MAEEETLSEEAAQSQAQESGQETRTEREGVENLRVLENIESRVNVR